MIIIGELINGMYRDVDRAIVNREADIIQHLALEQVKEGASTIRITKAHLYAAINRVKPTASRDMLHQYERIATEFAKFSVTEEEPNEHAAKPEFAGYA